MKFFLDTANIDEIKRISQLGLVDGVTTNPTIIAREGRDFKQVIQEIAALADVPVSAEVTAMATETMIEEAKLLANWAPNIVVKLPMCEAGLAAVHQLSLLGIKTNVTLIFTVAQGLMAAKAGATYVSPFLGRLDDIGVDGLQIVRELRQIFDFYGYPSEIIAASIRSISHVEKAALAGSHIATIPGTLFDKLWVHPLTDKGISTFLSDWESYKATLK